MRTWIGIGVFVAVVLVAFAVFVFRTSEGRVPAATATTTPTISAVTLDNTYKSGVHTLTGTATLTNRCLKLSADAIVIGSSTPEVIEVDLAAPEDDGLCLELPYDASYSVTAHAGEDATVVVYANGQVITPTAVPTDE